MDDLGGTPIFGNTQMDGVYNNKYLKYDLQNFQVFVLVLWYD